MTARRSWTWWAGLACAAIATGCGRSAGESGRAEPAVPVRVSALVERSFAEEVVAPGQWRTTNEIVLTTPFAAIVESLRPHIGDGVSGGETLAVLVTRESRATLRGAELMLRLAKDSDARSEAGRALELARREVVRVPLVASHSGTVVRRAAEPGAELAESAELLAIVPRDELVFEAHVAAADAERVRAGQPARIVTGGGEPVAADVQRRLPGVNLEDQSVLVWLGPKNAAPLAAIGRFGSARIETGAPRRGVAVPDSALVEDDLTGEARLVRVDQGNIAIWTPVRLGRAQDGWHELLAPRLPPGTRVVVAGHRGLPDSVRVTPR
jgi:multidrug efflux pump subunit AcrA (membrane-fusion protein)